MQGNRYLIDLRDGVRNARIDSHGAQEGASILDVRVTTTKKHGEAGDSEKGHGHVAIAWKMSDVDI